MSLAPHPRVYAVVGGDPRALSVQLIFSGPCEILCVNAPVMDDIVPAQLRQLVNDLPAVEIMSRSLDNPGTSSFDMVQCELISLVR